MLYKIDKETMEICKALEFYDLHHHFPFEKKVVSFSISYEDYEKLKNLNKSKIIGEILSKPLWDEKTGKIIVSKEISTDEMLKIMSENPIFQEELKEIGGIVCGIQKLKM